MKEERKTNEQNKDVVEYIKWSHQAKRDELNDAFTWIAAIFMIGIAFILILAVAGLLPHVVQKTCTSLEMAGGML